MPRRRSSKGRSGRSGGRFDQAKHPRGRAGNRGQFASKPAADDSASPRPDDLKERNVGRGDQIVDLRDGGQRDLGTVGAYIDRHPGGSAAAIDRLRREHARGRIGFRAAAAERPRDPAVKSAVPLPWAGTAQPRDLTNDALHVDAEVYRSGLVHDEADLRRTTAALTAGIPANERIDVTWNVQVGAMVMHARNDRGVELRRDFYHDGDGWTVEHVAFELPIDYRGTGNARLMMRASVEEYDRLGVSRIETEAGGQDGGYVWARAGFVASNELTVRQYLMRGAVGLDAADFEAVSRVLTGAGPGAMMSDLAALSVPSNTHLGRDFLRGTQWHGHIDLTDSAHRARLIQYFR
jgi:hypothetical protein